MADITLEKTHNLLEKFVEYVMQNLTTKSEFNELKEDVTTLKGDVGTLKEDVTTLKANVDTIITGMDGQAKQMEALRIEQAALHHGLKRIEKKIDTHEKVLH